MDHGGTSEFIDDYGGIGLHGVAWRVETIPATDLRTMPTGASDAGCIESYAEDPVRSRSVPGSRPELGKSTGPGCARLSPGRRVGIFRRLLYVAAGKDSLCPGEILLAR